jgi:L-asparaginase II
MERKNPFLLLNPAVLPPEGDKPLEICLLRGEAIESRHRVHALVCEADGSIAHRWGNPGLSFYPRSAVKLLQATAWVSRGIEKAWKLGDEELALACASHEGENDHVRVVTSWLEKLGCREKDLECGAHYPYHQASAHALIRANHAPSQIHNNCSGKHSGFLSFCRSCDWETAGYTNYDHPVQAAVREALGEFLGTDMRDVAWGIDGCGIPTYSVELCWMGRAMAKLADPRRLPASYGEAVRTLNAAVAKKPRFIGGTDSFCTKVVSETEGRVFAKLGAEGVYGAWIPQAGLGLAMKCEDGAARATEVAMAAVLRELGFPLGFFSPLVKRWTGEVVGEFFCA